MKFWKYTFLLLTTGFLFIFVSKNVFASSQYTNLGDLGGQSALAHGINNSGQIVGESFVDPQSPSTTHAFLWQNGTMSDLGTLGGATSQAFGINDSGVIVGAADNVQNQSHAFILQNGVMTDLNVFGANQSAAVAVNNNNQVVGYYYNSSGQSRGFLWQNGVVTDIGALASDGNGWTIPNDINDSGEIVGQSTLTNENQDYHAFLWQNGTMTDLGLLGGFQSSASSINNQGLIVGYSTTNNAGNSRPVLWQNGTIINLGSLGSNTQGQATSINDNNQIVGWSDLDSSGSNRHGFIWQNNIMYDLEVPEGNTIIPSKINNSTESVGYWNAGSYYHAFLMIPQQSVDIKANGSDGSITIPYNSSVTISWNSDYTNSCQISPLGINSTNGSQVLNNLTTSQTYTINCTGLNGNTSDSVTVKVPSAVFPSADSYINIYSHNFNEGSSPFVELDGQGHERALFKFDESQIQAAVGNSTNYTATLQLTITNNANNWSTGRTIDLLRLNNDWVEGNGFINGNNLPNRGTGSGVTWSCGIDSDISNNNKNCGTTAWDMTNSANWPFSPIPTSTQTITNHETGLINFDVTNDIKSFLNGTNPNYGWILKKTDETVTGKIDFGSKESSNSPILLITKQ